MSLLHTAWLDESIGYSGKELAAHWISQRTGLYQSSIVAFRGPTSVRSSEMVDLEDRRKHLHIEAKEMLHFLGEWFDGDLNLAVTRQRLLIAGFAEELRRNLKPVRAHELFRRGNDLFFLDGHGAQPFKLSVSIVTASPISTLFHFGVNIDTTGAPVKAIGLNELGVKADVLARAVLQNWCYEWESMAKARCKVAPR
jgi:uncharacterized protein